MAVPILKQGDGLIASVQGALSDAALLDLRDELSERVGRFRSNAVIIDVTALDVVDSFASRARPRRSPTRCDSAAPRR